MLSLVAGLGILLASQGKPPLLNLPPRNDTSVTGSALAMITDSLSPKAREERFFKEVREGNVPSFLRKFVSVALHANIGGKELAGSVFVLPDYLAIGSDDDFLYIPMTPFTAQRVADLLNCSLPTPKLVDAIHDQAQNKFEPRPIPPSPEMTRVKVFLDHTQIIDRQRAEHPFLELGLTAGHKKDIVISKALEVHQGKVAIYGWHKLDGKPIQPLYLGHDASWADYSHGVRLVSNKLVVDGNERTLNQILRSPTYAALLSNEGALKQTRYQIADFPEGNSLSLVSGEVNEWIRLPGVRVLINRPITLNQKVRLVFYALPNGNTIEQTIGSTMTVGKDWHFDIQHIGAQTRFLRHRSSDESLVVAYLEASNFSWPAFLHSPGSDPQVPQRVYSAITHHFGDRNVHVVLDSHSGGGAFVFDLIKSWDRIPYQVDRIAFLDSEYNYDTEVHLDKLTQWLRIKNRHLCVIAYDDSTALYNGKPIVTPSGGTWGRSHALLSDLARSFRIENQGDSDPEKWEGLSGQIVFLLKQNPKHLIFHTVQVERNGFIETLLSGVPLDGVGYRYFGDRAYRSFIAR